MTSIADLEIFAKVVTAGSMSAAGRELDLSPTVVSKRISHLETKLGTRLFHRTTRQLQLSETGRGFYERVVQILATVQEAEAFVSSGHERVGGTIKVTAPSGFSRMHIAPYLGKFLKQYPDLSIDLIATDQILDIVRDGIDVAIRISELEDTSLVAKKIVSCRRLFCATPDYLKEHGTPKTLAELLEHRTVAENNMTWRVQGSEGIKTVKPSGEIKTNNSDIVYEAVLGGCGIAFLSTWQVREALLSQKLVPILSQYREAPDVAVYAIYPDKQYVPARLRVFVDFLADIYGSTPYWDQGLNLDAAPSRLAQKKILNREIETAEA